MASLGYDTKYLTIKLEGISLGVCEHGSCLVPDSWVEWSGVGCQELLEVGRV